MKHPVFARFFARKFAASLLPVVIPLIILGAVTLYLTDNFFGREVVMSTTRQLENLKQSLDQTVFELDSLNLAFGSNPTIISAVDNLLATSSVSVEDAYLARLINDLLNAQIDSRPYVASVYLYLDRRPDKLFTTDMGVVSVADYADTAWIRSYRATPPSDLLWTQSRLVRLAPYEKTPHRYFTMYRRLFPAVTGREGVIVMNLEEEYMQHLVAQSALYPDQEVDVIGQRGNLILTTNPDGAMSRLADSMRATDTPSLARRSVGGNEYFVYSSRTARYGWRIVTTIPTARLNRIQTIIRSSILALLGVSLVIGALLTFSFARRSARRVAVVTNLFARADSGEDIVDVPEPRNDEYDYMVEALIRTFLKQRYATLQLSERQARAENLELRALRAQINPHFLFNTLDSLYWMVYGPGGLPSPASRMIKDLSSLLRYSLEDTEEVNLEHEIENCRRYMAIQKHRYGDNFDVVWNISSDTLPSRGLKLMLQPLLENAIYHGVKEYEARDRSGRRTIEVGSRIEAGSTVVTVCDDGRGMSAERLAEVRESLSDTTHTADHIGIYNTNRRIRLTFGGHYGLRVDSEAGRGTCVEVVLPAPNIPQKSEPDRPAP